MPVLFEEQGGILEPEKMIAAHVQVAQHHGAHVHTGKAAQHNTAACMWGTSVCRMFVPSACTPAPQHGPIQRAQSLQGTGPLAATRTSHSRCNLCQADVLCGVGLHGKGRGNSGWRVLPTGVGGQLITPYYANYTMLSADTDPLILILAPKLQAWGLDTVPRH